MTALRAVCVRALYARGVCVCGTVPTGSSRCVCECVRALRARCVCAGPSPRVAPTRVWTKGERLCAPALVRRTYNTVFKYGCTYTQALTRRRKL